MPSLADQRSYVLPHSAPSALILHTANASLNSFLVLQTFCFLCEAGALLFPLHSHLGFT